MIRDSQWDTRDVAEACGVCVQGATRKIDELGRRLARVAAAMRTAEPGIRPDRLAELLLSEADGLAALRRHDERRTRAWVREVIG